MLLTCQCQMFWCFRSLFGCLMMTLSHWLTHMIVDVKCRENDAAYVGISHSADTVAVSDDSKCQLKLRHSVTSLAQTTSIKVAHRRHPVEVTLNQLILKMIAHKLGHNRNHRQVGSLTIFSKLPCCDSCSVIVFIIWIWLYFRFTYFRYRVSFIANL